MNARIIIKIDSVRLGERGKFDECVRKVSLKGLKCSSHIGVNVFNNYVDPVFVTSGIFLRTVPCVRSRSITITMRLSLE